MSYRYRRAQLFLVDSIKDFNIRSQWYLRDVWEKAGLKGSIVVTAGREGREGLFEGFDNFHKAERMGKLLEVKDIDVKNLLEQRRVVIERAALDRILKEHRSDLGGSLKMVSSDLPPIEEIELA